MEFQKIVNFPDTTSDDKDLSRFVTIKWIEVYDQSKKTYNPNKEIRIKKPMLGSDLCNFNDVYIVVEGDVALEGDNDANKIKILHLKIMHHLLIAFQKLVV